jgi:predicted dehydrogenase
VPQVFPTLEAAVARSDVVYDLAVPGGETAAILDRLPAGVPVLMQKPMGETLAAASAILAICRTRRLLAAVNFQLRFSPNALAMRDFIARGRLGALSDLEVRVVDRQPWEQWPFLSRTPRLEVLYHSIHYLDLIRAIAGEPRSVFCLAVRDPAWPALRDTRSTIMLDYGEMIRCSLVLNHTHRHDARHRASMFKIEGTAGAAVLTMGVNLDYPSGPPDELEVAEADGAWRPIPLRGSWFPHAFEGPMSNLQRVAAGEDDVLCSSVEDAWRTMALVEACYRSNETGRSESCAGMTP